MQITILLAFLSALTAYGLAAPGASRFGWDIPLTAVGYIFMAAFGGWLHRVAALRAIRLMRDGGQKQVKSLSIYIGLACQAWLIGGIAICSMSGLGSFAKNLLGQFPLAGELLILLPFLAAVLLVWLIEYPIHIALRSQPLPPPMVIDRQACETPPALSCWRIGKYMEYTIRHNLLFVGVPICLIVLATDSIELYVLPAMEGVKYQGLIAVAGTLAVILGIFLVIPMLIVKLWRTEPLPEGPLRQCLEDLCRRMKLGFRDILIWKTDCVIANAGMMGLVSPMRYVLISDGILSGADGPQVQSVFGHEAGHAANRHLPFMMLYVISVGTICQSASFGLMLIMTHFPEIFGILNYCHFMELGPLILMLMILGLTFGPISRRMERQSDVWGAWAANPQMPDRITPLGAEIFADALERISMLNGIIADKHNWRHGSIESRIKYILELARAGGDKKPADRTVGRIKKIIWLCFLLAATATATLAGYFVQITF